MESRTPRRLGGLAGLVAASADEASMLTATAATRRHAEIDCAETCVRPCFRKGTTSQTAEKFWFWVEQRFSAAIEALFSIRALAAAVLELHFSAACAVVPLSPLFFSFRAGASGSPAGPVLACWGEFSPRGICSSQFFRSLGSLCQNGFVVIARML